ncbi:hypothetical protein [Nocardioides sp. WS12]|uniref:hypothetical protein n=1 Tax=Nocardioides sp. WS12 TaxID=2486272 RepID=UPI0015FC79E8|nr:hypothetical protein [Nocardioides sp. WS12]
MSAHDEWWATEKVRRKFGTEVPHEPTDEFVKRAFMEGARSLWPDSRDPGWYVTFGRWLEAHVASKQAEAWDLGHGTTCDGITSSLDGCEKHNPYRTKETP